MRKRGAFTLIELLVVVLILGVLVTILVPVVGNFLREARKAKCLTNLRAIKTAIDNKLGDNAGNRIFALAFGEGNPNAPLQGATTNTMENFIATGDVNAMQNAWAMVDSYGVDWRAFVCPGDGGQTDRIKASTDKYGWTALTEFSYGIQHPYGTYGINNASLKDRVVIMADRNPGGPVGEDRPHSNHPHGVSVLFHDGNIKFYEADDSKAGYRKDEIYTNKADPAVPGGDPVDVGDTSITPCPSR